MNEILFQEILDESGRGYRRFKNTIRGQQCVPQDSLDWWIASAAFELGRAAGMREEVSAAVAGESEQDKKDAERYRWLRDNRLNTVCFTAAMGWLPQKLKSYEIDAAIDVLLQVEPSKDSARSNSAAGQTETP